MEDLNDKVTGGTLTAAEWNQVPSEIQNVIEGLGITLSSGDLNQLGKAIAGYVGNGTFYTDSGAADAYVLTTIGSKQSLTAYTDGATFEFIADNANTGASTVNVAALGVKNIKLPDGTDPAAGQIDGRTVLKFDSANDRCELIQSGMVTTTVISATGTYNPPAGVKTLEFTVVGAGGGAGGVASAGVGTAAATAGGGAAGAAVKTTSSIESSYTVTIGAGGSGGAAGANDGTNGGNTTIVSVAVNITATGGLRSTGETATSGSIFNTGGSGSNATGGDVNFTGSDGWPAATISGDPASGGQGAPSIFGGAAKSQLNSNGSAGAAPGAGGSGAIQNGGSTDRAGGSGANGIVIVKEFF